MDLKNWAFSLFLQGKPLYEQGFTNVRPTPAIMISNKKLTPDIVAWSGETVLTIECCSVEPNADADVEKIKKYLEIPADSLQKFVGTRNFTHEGVLLYFDDKLQSDKDATNRLLGKIALERNIIVWSCVEGLQMKLVIGNHSNQSLNSLLEGGLPLDRFPYPQIEVQPDSPKELLTRLLFKRLFERACKNKETRFTVDTAIEILDDQSYAFDPEEGVKKISKVITLGIRLGLCLEEQANRIWRLNFFPDKILSVEAYLKKLSDIITIPRLTSYFEKEENQME
jgi:hypothetical protein